MGSERWDPSLTFPQDKTVLYSQTRIAMSHIQRAEERRLVLSGTRCTLLKQGSHSLPRKKTTFEISYFHFHKILTSKIYTWISQNRGFTRIHLCVTCAELKEVSLKDIILEIDLSKIVRSQKKTDLEGKYF